MILYIGYFGIFLMLGFILYLIKKNSHSEVRKFKDEVNKIFKGIEKLNFDEDSTHLKLISNETTETEHNIRGDYTSPSEVDKLNKDIDQLQDQLEAFKERKLGINFFVTVYYLTKATIVPGRKDESTLKNNFIYAEKNLNFDPNYAIFKTVTSKNV